MQNPLRAGLILGVIGLIIGFGSGRPMTFGLLGFLLGHALATSTRVTNLQQALEKLRAEFAKQAGDQSISAQAAQSVQPASVEQIDLPEPVAVSEAVPQSTASPQSTPSPSSSPSTASPPPLARILRSAISWLTGGNVFMKAGIGLLFLGVGFLLNYVAGQGFFTLEMRLIAIAGAAIAGLVVGQRLLAQRRDYGLLLQGAAIGILYLDIFAAFSLYELVPVIFAFALLVAISALAATLAVMHKAPSLAFAGFAGGFLAPLLASSGSGNHIGLFSYYLVLDGAIVGIAWFRSWRGLNLLGLYFTFAIAALWGADAYAPDKYASTQPFLVLFFVFFVAISVLYARRQPPQLKGYVDASLLFATPVLAFSMQIVMMEPYEYGSAWSAFAFGSFYITVAALLWRQRREGEQLLVEVFVSLGVIFTTLVIPFALGAADTAGAWALEGAGMIWIGLRQDKVQVRLLGLVLQLAAAFFWLAHHPADGQQMFVNSSYLAGVLIALGGFFSAWLYRTAPTRWEAPLHALFVGFFVAWWYGIGFREIVHFAETEHIANWIVGYTAVSALLVVELARRWDWTLMRMTSLFAPLPFGVAAVYLLFDGVAPHAQLGWLIWPSALLAYAWMLYRCEDGTYEPLLSVCHIAWAAMLLGYLQWEMAWLGIETLTLEESWFVAWMALVPILALQIIHLAAFWPVVNWARTYAGFISLAIAVTLSTYILFSLGLDGGAQPLPWVPLLNPLDLITLIAVFAVYRACVDMSHLFPRLGETLLPRIASLGLALAVFAWLNVTLFRSLHHWRDFPYDLQRMLDYSFTQTSLSILWVTLGMLLVVTATRLVSRAVWIAGAVLLAVVVLKLFVQDLANTGSLARIISFLGVGGMLVVIGYFSPLPPKKDGSLDEASGVQL